MKRVVTLLTFVATALLLASFGSSKASARYDCNTDPAIILEPIITVYSTLTGDSTFSILYIDNNTNPDGTFTYSFSDPKYGTSVTLTCDGSSPSCVGNFNKTLPTGNYLFEVTGPAINPAPGMKCEVAASVVTIKQDCATTTVSCLGTSPCDNFCNETNFVCYAGTCQEERYYCFSGSTPSCQLSITLGTTTDPTCPGTPCDTTGGPPPPGEPFPEALEPSGLITGVAALLVPVAILFSVARMIQGGYYIMLSRGDEAKIIEGKEIFTSAVIGLVLSLTGIAVLNVIFKTFIQ